MNDNPKAKGVRFDNALGVLASYLRDVRVDPRDGVFLRDGFGRIGFYSNAVIAPKLLSQHRKALAALLGPVSLTSGALNGPADIGATVLKDNSPLPQTVNIDGTLVQVRVVDRRFFGRDWLAVPAAPIPGVPPLITFGSLKGGVGRTTALFVLAIHLARKGRNVLLLDLDLEAPGLASMVFEGDERPQYGILDYLVENGLGGITDSDLTNFVGTSRLTDRQEAGGRVDLAPATGTVTLDNPSNMLAKLARALVEDPAPTGPPRSLGTQIRDLVDRLARRTEYDAVLVDARAGLGELSAGPLLCLGGTVALFGTNHLHTFEGYRYLMAHLALLKITDPENDWRERIKFVHSMAAASIEQRQLFDDRLYEMLSETFYEEDNGEDVFNFSLDDEEAPHRPWRVFFDGKFLDMNPIVDRSLLEEDIYRAVFGTFIDAAETALNLARSTT